MSQIRIHSNRKRSGMFYEEEKAWRGFYQRVTNPDIAVEILHQLDADEEMKRSHLALYLCCKETLRTAKSRQARNKRIGQFVRLLAEKLCVAPWRAIKRWLRNGGEVVVECLPEVRREPAVHQAERLGKDGDFAQAKAAFDTQDAQNAQNATPAPSSVNKAVSRSGKNAGNQAGKAGNQAAP
jgi:hypothetical protein